MTDGAAGTRATLSKQIGTYNSHRPGMTGDCDVWSSLMKTDARIMLLLLSTCAGGTTAMAENPKSEADSSQAEVRGTPSAQPRAGTDSHAHAIAGPGLKAAIDPTTGKLTPVPSSIRRTEVVTPESPFGMRNDALMWTETLSDGTVVLHTEGQIQMASFAKFNDEGKPETYCDSVALKPGHAPAQAAGKEEEKQP